MIPLKCVYDARRAAPRYRNGGNAEIVLIIKMCKYAEIIIPDLSAVIDVFSRLWSTRVDEG